MSDPLGRICPRASGFGPGGGGGGDGGGERGRDRFGFRLVHFSVQGNHLHLIVEAPDERALARGMQGLGVRIAKALNRVMGRKGSVLADHYHVRQLRSPAQVANALAYVLLNFVHHFPDEKARHAGDLRDRFSSAWREDGKDPPVVAPRTWLLSIGWRVRADARLDILRDGSRFDSSPALSENAGDMR